MMANHDLPAPPPMHEADIILSGHQRANASCPNVLSAASDAGPICEINCSGRCVLARRCRSLNRPHDAFNDRVHLCQVQFQWKQTCFCCSFLCWNLRDVDMSGQPGREGVKPVEFHTRMLQFHLRYITGSWWTGSKVRAWTDKDTIGLLPLHRPTRRTHDEGPPPATQRPRRDGGGVDSPAEPEEQVL